MRVYKKSFTQQELDGIIAFYKTLAGQAAVNKLPVVMQNTMAEMQQMMQPIMSKMRQHGQEVAAEVKNVKEPKEGG